MPSHSKPCHNCRRRRLRCDRSWPTCHKCAVSGQECLGYGKVFIWAEAIDAHGNPKPSPSRRTPLGGPLGSGSGHVSSSVTNSYFPLFPDPSSGHRPDGVDPSNQAAHDASVSEGRSIPVVRRPSPLLKRNRSAAAMSATPEPTRDAASSPIQESPLELQKWRPAALGSLTDPIFQDLDRNSRYYLFHCKRRPDPKRYRLVGRKLERDFVLMHPKLPIVSVKTWWPETGQGSILFEILSR